MIEEGHKPSFPQQTVKGRFLFKSIERTPRVAHVSTNEYRSMAVMIKVVISKGTSKDQ